MSEEMMFGLASGLSFLYLNQSQSPMINGRSKVFEFEKKLAQRLHIQIHCPTSKHYETVFLDAKKNIDASNPILIYVDMSCLRYLGLAENAHFGGHAVVLFGYADELETCWISNRDNHDYPIRVPSGSISKDYHLVDYEEVKRARSSRYRPFPAVNQYLSIDFNGFQAPHAESLKEAILETVEQMLHPGAKLLGIHGILKFFKEVLKWRCFDDHKLRLAGTTNYFQISKDGGTGGGIFRHMYGMFLMEASTILQIKSLQIIAQRFIDVSYLWDAIADDMWMLSLHQNRSLLEMISTKVKEIYQIEQELYLSLYQLITS